VIENAAFFPIMDSLAQGKTKPCKLAVAVSGGADSLCLCFLASEWAKANGVELTALTVDHGLRAESAQEAEFVHHLLNEKAISHTTLKWTGKKPKTRIEEKAREARYRLLLTWCQENQVPVLLLAHHQDDQAETFFLRLIRSSGVDGLSAMQPKTIRNSVELWRPFLRFSRQEIHQTMMNRFHQIWIEDPSNQSMDYERVRLRQFQKQLDGLGLTTQAVALSAKRLLRARQALEKMTDNWWHQHVLCHAGGFVFIDKQDLNELPSEIVLRILNKALCYVSGGNEPRMAQLEKIYEKLSQKLCTTLCECVIILNKQGLYVCKELARMSKPFDVVPNQEIKWNGFIVKCNQKVQIAPLNGQLKIKGVPAMVAKTIPAFFDKKGLAFVPAVDYKRKRMNITGIIEKKE